MADLRIVDAPLLSTVKGTEKIPTGGEGNFSVSVNQVADFAKLKWFLATEEYVGNAVGNVQAELNLHKNNVDNPHQVTKEQVGLGNVENTADLDKPVSNSTQAAISQKADKSGVYTKQESSDLVSSSISTALNPVNSSLDLAKRGIYNRYDPLLTYNSGETVILTNGDIVKSTIDGNTANPNTNRTGWVSFGNSNIVFHGDVVYPEYSPFSYMSVNDIPLTRKYNMRNYIAEKPSGFTWNVHGFKFWLDSDSVLKTNIKPDDYDVASKAVDKVEYFIKLGGSTNNATSGTDPETPLGGLYMVFNKINIDNVQNAVIWVAPDVYTDSLTMGIGDDYRIKSNISIKPWNQSTTAPYLDTTDSPIVITTESTGLVWTSVGSGVYSTTRAAVSAVTDDLILNDLYDPSRYTKVSSLALCTSTSGSWFQGGTTLYVHTLDSRTPDAKLHVYVQKDNAYFLGGNYTAYLERVWLYGGTTACYGTTALTNTTETIFFNKCKFRYSTNNGMSFFGMKYCIAYECESSYNGSDGYNYHADTTLAKKTQNVEFKCVAYRNGTSWSPVRGVNNGSTTHDGCDIVRAGTVVFENQGPNIADVNGGNSWLFNCISRNSLNPLGGAVNCDFYSSQNKMWLDHCDSSGSLYSAAAIGSGVKMYVRNCNLYARLSQAANFENWSTARYTP